MKITRAGEYIICQTESETFVFFLEWPKSEVSDEEVKKAVERAKRVLDNLFEEPPSSLRPLFSTKAQLKHILAQSDERLCLVFETEKELEIYHLDSGEVESNVIDLKGAFKKEPLKKFLLHYLKKSLSEPISQVSSEVSDFAEKVSQFRGKGIVRRAGVNGLVIASVRGSFVWLGVFLINNEWIVSEVFERRARVRAVSSLDGMVSLGRRVLLFVEKDDLALGDVREVFRFLLPKREEEIVVSQEESRSKDGQILFFYGEALKGNSRLRFEVREVLLDLFTERRPSLKRRSFSIRAYSLKVSLLSQILKSVLKEASKRTNLDLLDWKSIKKSVKKKLVQGQPRSL